MARGVGHDSGGIALTPPLHKGTNHLSRCQTCAMVVDVHAILMNIVSQ